MSAAAAEKKLIFGIDIGTTETRIMHTESNPQRMLRPLISSFTIDQTTAFPTTIGYENDWNRNVVWGPKTGASGYTVYPWLKLHLYSPNHPILQELKRTNIPTLPNRITPEKALSDFLKPLYQAIQEWINDKWEKDAGFGANTPDKVFFVDEAEAVTLYFADCQGYKTPEDGCILICDVGGGTIKDVDVFEIRGTGVNPLYVSLKSSSGADSGGAAMDAVIAKCLENQLACKLGVLKLFIKAQLEYISLVKYDFEGNGNIPVVLDEESGIVISQAEFKACLQGIIDGIICPIYQYLDALNRIQKLISVSFLLSKPFILCADRSLKQYVLLVGGPSIPDTTQLMALKDVEN
ncbi:hypothetical protein BO79DRAFT_272034 [Aspergillus costaricaensis CBS 115574]|uniref:Uncharacterized protein n=1 Tax=Aspergillus costaricaensis CBS 115574 TaxID=1448317 RepID=A0ACD1I725_9EURO|nr:hypothetical protein BO79DRAFT_272034 [Aspergillus costaricaensis CBS 115574]RAK85796.1 hypothetical protein BO79DRAFT_272034 [Aspergillus costaricaensis CBS 115574]